MRRKDCLPAAGYQVAGVGNFNGDGAPDLVFQNSSTGAVVFWYMSGAQFQSGSAASAFPSANFKAFYVEVALHGEAVPTVVT